MTDRQRKASERVLSEKDETLYALSATILDALQAHGEALQTLGDAFLAHSDAFEALAAEYQDALVAVHEGTFDDGRPLADALNAAADATDAFNNAFLNTTMTLDGFAESIDVAFNADENM